MRKFFTIPLWFIGFVIVVAVAGYLWLTQSSWLRNQLEAKINSLLGATTDLVLSVDGMTGDLISGVTMTGVSVAISHDGRVDTLALVDQVIVRYDLRHLLSQNRGLRAIEMYHPQVFVPRDSIESVFRKAGTEIAAKTELGSSLELALDSIAIHGGEVYLRGEPAALADSVEIRAAFRASSGEWTFSAAPSSAHTIWVGLVQFEGVFASRPGSWRCDSLSAKTSKSSLFVSGSLDSVQIHAAELDMREISQAAKLDFDGHLAVSGTIVPNAERTAAAGQLKLAGTFDGFDISDLQFRYAADSVGLAFDSLTGVVSNARFQGNGRFVWSAKPETWEFTGRVDGFDLNRFAKETVPTSLSGHVQLNGIGVSDSDLRVRAEVDLIGGTIDKVRFESAEGSLGATVDSLLIGEDFRMSVNGATLVGGGAMAFKDSIDMFVSFESADLRPFDRSVFIDSLAGRASGYAYLTGMSTDPDIAAFLTSDSLRLFDLRTADFEARVFVPHFLSNPSGQVDANWGAASTWGIPTDSISLHATLSGREINIGWARWYSPQIAVEGSGILNWAADTIPLNLYPLTMRWGKQTYSASDNVILTIDSTGFNLHQFSFEGPLGIFVVSGRLGFDNSMALDYQVDQFRIAKVWSRMFPTWDVDGVVSAKGRLGGTIASPEIQMIGEISELDFEGDSYGTLRGDISYRDRVLHVESAELDSRYLRASASGTFPVNLTLDSIGARVLVTEPLSGRLEASGDNLDPINRFLPQTIESIRGNFSLQAEVTGTPQSPKFTGEANLTQGTIKTIDIINPLEDVAVDVALHDDTVIIRNASAVVRDKNQSGKVDVKGRLRIASIKSFEYDLIVTGRGVPARMEFQDFYVLSDFDLTVTGLTPPKVTGRVLPKRIEDREPMSESEAKPVYDESLWDWDIAIEMPEGGYSIRNDQIEAELSADLRLLRARGQPSYIGTAEFIRGSVYLFDKVGRITRGVLTFDDPLSADPRLDIDVGFRIQQPRLETRTETSGSPVIDLNLHIAGRASEPLIEPEAPYSEQDVLLLLAANTSSFGGSDSLSVSDPLANRLKFAATGLVFSEVQRAAARKLGLETLQINSGADPFDASITVGRYFSPQLYLYGTSPIDAGSGQEVGFEYRVSRRIFLDGNRDKNNLYRMNIHFNWEY